MDPRTELGWVLILTLAAAAVILLGMLRTRRKNARREAEQENFIWIDRKDGEAPR